MDRAAIQELIRQLRSPDESLRLRAASQLGQGVGDEGRLALPSLKDAFLHDPNPAVRFLAAKALRHLGFDPEVLESASKIPDEPDPLDSSAAGVLSLQGGVRAFWRTAQEYLRVPFCALCRLAQTNPRVVAPAIIRRADQLGADLLVPHLVEIHKAFGGPATDRASRLASVASRWHRYPRETLFADRDDLRGAALSEVLAELVESQVELVRAAALCLIDEVDAGTVEMLLSLLADPSPLVGEGLERTLILAGKRDPALAARIVQSGASTFEGGRPSPRAETAARVFAELASPSVVPQIRLLWGRLSEKIRVSLIPLLERAGVGEADLLEMVGPLLDSADGAVSLRAATCLGALPTGPRVSCLLTMWLESGEGEVRAKAARVLGETGTAESLGRLVNSIGDPDDVARRAALQALGRFRGDRPLRIAAGLLSDPRPLVRAVGFRMMIDCGGAQVLAALRAALTTGREPAFVRLDLDATRLKALGFEGLPRTVELAVDDPFGAEIVATALEALGDPKVLPVADGLAVRSQPRVRACAARLLFKFGELWGTDMVSEMLLGSDPVAWEVGIDALAEFSSICRLEPRLLQYPLLRAAIRRHPTFDANIERSPGW